MKGNKVKTIFLTILALMMVSVLCSCRKMTPQEHYNEEMRYKPIRTSDGSISYTPHTGSPHQICIDGVVYLNIGHGLSVKFDKDSKVVTCGL